jgi:hypothetical protein
VPKAVIKLKADKAYGPDKVAPRLLTKASHTVIPSLLSLLTSSSTRNSVPDQWKRANVSSLYKKDDEIDKS